MGNAPAAGIALMGLWKQVARFFGAGLAADNAKLEQVQRLLLEADFGVAATNETVERLSRAKQINEASLERIVVEQLGPPATSLARADKPPTVVLVSTFVRLALGLRQPRASATATDRTRS